MCDSSGSAIQYSCSRDQISQWGLKMKNICVSNTSREKMASLLYGGTVKFSSKLLHGYYREPVSLSLSHELEIKGFIGNILTLLAFVAEMCKAYKQIEDFVRNVLELLNKVTHAL